MYTSYSRIKNADRETDRSSIVGAVPLPNISFWQMLKLEHHNSTFLYFAPTLSQMFLLVVHEP